MPKRKSYLYIQDCIDAMLMTQKQGKEKISVYNLGTDEYCQVNDSIKWICEYLNVTPKLSYTGGDRGWIGDNPFIFLDCTKICKRGWKPKLSIREGVRQTIKYLHENPWVLETRS